MREEQIMARSHNINSKWNHVLSGPLFVAGAVTTLILFVSPYWLRTLIAFVVNFLFNRPIIYHFYFFEKIGKKMNTVVVSVFYFFIFGVYAVVIQLLQKKVDTHSVWKASVEELAQEDHYFQS